MNNSDGNSVDDQDPLPYKTEIRPAPEFSYEGAMNKLLSLPPLAAHGNNVEFLVPTDSILYDEDLPPDELGLTNRRGKLLQISAWLDLDSKLSIGCIGAVLAHLQRKRSARYSPNDPGASQAFRVDRLEMFSIRGTM